MYTCAFETEIKEEPTLNFFEVKENEDKSSSVGLENINDFEDVYCQVLTPVDRRRLLSQYLFKIKSAPLDESKQFYSTQFDSNVAKLGVEIDIFCCRLLGRILISLLKFGDVNNLLRIIMAKFSSFYVPNIDKIYFCEMLSLFSEIFKIVNVKFFFIDRIC